MRIASYTPDLYPALAAALTANGATSALNHQPFVDYYYTNNPFATLHMMVEADGAVMGTLGLELMPFEHRGAPITLGFGTNFHSFKAGVGGHLFLTWIRNCTLGLVFGASEDTHRIIRSQQWRYFAGIKELVAMPPRQLGWRGRVKRMLGLAPRRSTAVETIDQRLKECGLAIAVHEEAAVTADMLPEAGPFTLRVAPRLDYLNWRYRTGLSFARYRVFRILEGKDTAGYVILNDTPARLMVAQSDARHPETLAWGVLAALREAASPGKPRLLHMACAHPGMLEIYLAAGFKAYPEDRPFALGNRARHVDIADDPATWLVNFDWGDNGLRRPFLDEAPAKG